MERKSIGRGILVIPALAVIVAASGCDAGPTDTPYVYRSLEIAGSYRSTELTVEGAGGSLFPLEIEELRLSLGTQGGFTGRLVTSSAEPGEDASIRLSGLWSAEGSDVSIEFDPQVPGGSASISLLAEFFDNRVELTGALEVEGRRIRFRLLKPVNPGVGGGPLTPN